MNVCSRESGPNLTEFQRTLERDRLYTKRPTLAGALLDRSETLRIMSWNIERGYDLQRIASAIVALAPDVVCLQEVDWNNDRTGRRDVLQILSETTNMIGIFGAEFLELESTWRTRRSAGGGAIGNAILCRIPPTDAFRIELPAALDWEHGVQDETLPKRVRRRLKRERRMGNRFGLAAEFTVAGTQFLVCSAHFEDKFGGVSGRFRQYRSVLDAMAKRVHASARTFVVAGDFNTFDSKTARLVVPDTDMTALGRPHGVTEAEWWKNNLLPPTGFADPFAANDWTFRIPFLFRAKLDWITVKNGTIRDYGIGSFASSDHRPLWVDMELQSDATLSSGSGVCRASMSTSPSLEENGHQGQRCQPQQR